MYVHSRSSVNDVTDNSRATDFIIGVPWFLMRHEPFVAFAMADDELICI